jgi:hypothetical protein
LRGGYDAQLLTLDADETYGTDADLLVDALAAVVRWMAVGWGNAFISFINEGTATPVRRSREARPKGRRRRFRRSIPLRLSGFMDPLTIRHTQG